MERAILDGIDRLVSHGTFTSRSDAIESAVREKLVRPSGDRLARQCAVLDPSEERAWAEQGMRTESDTWPRY
ncbi:MAG: ribbon-helix-helix domain-containing protein [Planctomycetes bacterium]|jgi:Arc/MetJ-type ribon-helix-helix transcriptional regulator|nr:ribbon-helix-helix domain-containing protein [Planctomycetota bacterium]